VPPLRVATVFCRGLFPARVASPCAYAAVHA
jgi:hypothetical protein